MIIPDRIQCTRCHTVRPYSLTGMCRNCGFPYYTYVVDNAIATLSGHGAVVDVETRIIKGIFAEAGIAARGGMSVETQVIDSAMARAQTIIEIVRGCTQRCQQPWVGEDECACRNIVRRVHDALVQER